MSENKIRTVIVEAHLRDVALIRQALTASSFFEVVCTSHALPEAAHCVRNARPDIMILGFDGDVQAVLETCRQIKALQLGTKILLCGSIDDGPTTALFLRLGIDGYLPTSATPFELQRIVRDVARGTQLFSTGSANQIHTGPPRANSRNLTSREKQILEQLSEGHRNQDIARTLGISEKTVETHVRHVLLKLGVDSRTRAVVWALRSGWYQGNAYLEG